MMPEAGPIPQLELAARSAGQLRRLRIGLIAAMVAVVAGTAAAFGFVAWTSMAQTWPIVLIIGEVLIVGICLLQWWVWTRARGYWQGRSRGQLSGLVTPSVAAHLVSWAVAAITWSVALAMIVDVGFASPSAWLAAVAAVATLVAQLFGSAQHLRLAGPADTIVPDFASRMP